MDRLNTMRLFVRVVETASFSKAAKVEGVVQSTASKQVAALEKRLGTQLLRRTSRGLSTTAAGRDLYDALVRLLAELDAAEARATHGQGAVVGQLRVTAPAGFGRMYMVPLLPALLDRYPGLHIDLDVDDRYVNLVEEGFDVAVRVGQLRDSSLVSRRIGTFDVVTVASASYLERRGPPRSLGDLGRHACVAFMVCGSPRPWEFRSGKDAVTLTPAGPLRCNDAESVRAAVLAGLGITHVPEWLFADALASGAVARLLVADRPPRVAIHALCPSGRALSSKARTFIDFLTDEVAPSAGLRAR
ncbi:LysR family transcriptional regulator [Sorangium sp. So ce363]|uniref:LysR family transcriptional regulator n=1 Tax=Sorangium sp. So ce363 TaxID=3133304 RepID=UPI003F638C1C